MRRILNSNVDAARVLSITFTIAVLFVGVPPSACRAQDSLAIVPPKLALQKTEYFSGKRQISKEELERILISSGDPTVVNMTKAVNAFPYVEWIPGLAGGFFIAYGAFTPPHNLVLIVSGALCVIGALVMNSARSTNLTGAVGRYNEDLIKNTSYLPPGVPQSFGYRIGFSGSF